MTSSTYPPTAPAESILTRFPDSQTQATPESNSTTEISSTGTGTGTGTAAKPPAAEPTASVLPAATKTERFLLTAADQESGSRDERLTRVIRSKYEAGLLKPYNYVKGYARLSRWMDRKYVTYN
jgi:hypothetical protein